MSWSVPRGFAEPKDALPFRNKVYLDNINTMQNERQVLHLQADGIRRAQQQAASIASQLSGQQGSGTMTPSAKYIDIPLVEDDDFYFLGHPGERPPFYATPKPAFFDDYERACRGDQVATLQQITADNSCTPAMLHHGLTLSLATGSADCTRELLARGAPIARRAPERLLSAPQDKQILLLDALISHGWKPSHDLFMQSITNVEMLRWFLSHGANPNYGTKRDTPSKAGGPSYECADALEAAAVRGSAEAIEVLLYAGAKISYGVPLHRAAGASSPDTVGYIPNASQPEEFDTSRIPAMAVLVAHGADVNQKEDTPHMTPQYPLVYAVQTGAVQRARWLLEHGADPELKSPWGSAASYAAEMGSDEMKQLFQARARAT